MEGIKQKSIRCTCICHLFFFNVNKKTSIKKKDLLNLRFDGIRPVVILIFIISVKEVQSDMKCIVEL